MVGNKDTLPPYMEDASGGPAASDYRFSLLSGDQNVPAVFYGRLVADNADEVTTQVNRWIAYEKTPEQLDWYQDGAAIAGPKESNPSTKENGQQIQSILKQYTYKTVDGFFKGDGTATISNVDTALEAGELGDLFRRRERYRLVLGWRERELWQWRRAKTGQHAPAVHHRRSLLERELGHSPHAVCQSLGDSAEKWERRWCCGLSRRFDDHQLGSPRSWQSG